MRKKKRVILTDDEIKQIEESDVVLTICVITLEDLKKLNLIDSRILADYLKKSSDEENSSKRNEVD